MPAPNIIAGFVGMNENGILRHLTEGLMSLLEPHGYAGHIIDLADPGWGEQFDSLLQQGVAMAWGHAGVGAHLSLEGRPLWDLVGVPFISVLADPPCWMPRNHAVPSTHVVNAYVYQEWLTFQRRFIRAPQLSTFVEAGLIPNPARDEIPWRDRPRRMVFVKTGGDPQARRAKWSTYPKRWRAMIEDAVAAATAGVTGDITDLVLRAAEAHHLFLEQRPDILFALMTEVDLFVREARSTTMAAALADLPVDIYGRGWEHVSHLATRARFHEAFDAAAMPRMYAETQFMVNTTPNFASGAHERVAYGLDARCCIVSDQNAFMQRTMAALPTFSGLDLRQPDLRDRLASIFYDPTDYTDATQAGVDLVTQLYDGEAYMLSLLELAHETRAAAAFQDYRL